MRCSLWACSLLLLGCGHASRTSPGGVGGAEGAGGAESAAGAASHAGESGGGAGGPPSSGASGSSSVGGAPGATDGDAGAGGATSGDGDAAGSGGDAGSAALCPPASTTLSTWPGSATVRTLDSVEDYLSDLSGLTYESPGVLWAVNNLSSTLFRLVKSGTGYRLDTASGWSLGKSLRFPDGSGAPDSEGVTLGLDSASGVYVSSERNLSQPQVSRLSVLRYDVSDPEDVTLNATHEWDLTALLPAVDPNTGLEAITWVGDAWLTARGFFDESRGKPYSPSDYGDHGGGMFLVGVEQTGKVYGFALDHASGAATLLATLSTPLSGVMGMEMDRDVGQLWAYCDDTCDNQAAIFALAPSGRFELLRRVRSPSGLPGSNNEGIALAPDSECSDGVKPFFWTDDADAGGFSLRQGELACGCR